MTKPAIFLSTDFNADVKYPSLDNMSMREYFLSIAVMAAKNGCKLIVRNHPAVNSLLNSVKDLDLDVLPEDMSAKEINDKHHPVIALFIGGSDSTVQDYAELSVNRVKVLPIPRTGGASEQLYEQHKTTFQLSEEQMAIIENGGATTFACSVLRDHYLAKALQKAIAKPSSQAPGLQ